MVLGSYTPGAQLMFEWLVLLSSLLVSPRIAKAPSVRPHSFTLNHRAIEHAKRFTVLISAEGFGGIERGTGVLIDPTHVLTCYHVAAAQGELWVYPYPGDRVIKARPVYGDRSVDLAILELPYAVNMSSYAVFNAEIMDGEPITIIGNILGGMKWFVGYGIIGTTMGPYLLTDGLVLGGDSGGPWIDTAGRVVAISDFGFVGRNGTPLGLNGGVSAATIEAFLKAWKTPALMILLN